jgi:CRP/FNR family cyclic AMP-dependent transcriptional regulator
MAKTNPKIVQKIPLFQRLSFNQIQQVLHVGQMTTHPEGYLLCKDGDKSNAMFILLAGELAVKDGDLELARIKPVETVGEMGLISGEPRCASIEVVQQCTVILIGKMQFDALLRSDIDMASKIYKNVVDSLCQKLRENNTHLSRVLATAGAAVETTPA